jgi:hypothetical protein
MTSDSPVATAIASIMQVTDTADLNKIREVLDQRIVTTAMTPSGPPQLPGYSGVPGQWVTAHGTFSLGDKVALTGLAPNYINGAQGVVVGAKKSRGRNKLVILVEFINPSQRIVNRFGPEAQIPPQCLLKVAS